MNIITSKYVKLRSLAVCALMAAMACFTGCRKDKADMRKDNRFTTANRLLSTSRIVNLAGYNQVAANGLWLTDTVYHMPTDADAGTSIATKYFPKTGLLSNTWQIPQELLGAGNSVNLKFNFVSKGPVSQSTPSSLITLPAISEDYNKPMDYYLLSTRMGPSLPNYVAVERSTVQPSKPDHFKIRIINLMGTITGVLPSPHGQRENLEGPVTLAYADGTPVSDKTSSIAFSQRPSEYVEVPYGTYQFRVLTANGRQIPGANASDGTYAILHPPTSTIAAYSGNSSILNSKQTFAPINTYQPGGVYTIVVTPYSFNYFTTTNTALFEGGAFQNAYYVVNDISARLNTTYCRVQAANAMPGVSQANFKINGQPLPGSVNYGEASNYVNYIQGNYTIEATDASGTVLAKLTQLFRPEQNYTIWLSPDAAGKAQILFVPNDLSGFGAGSVGNGQDASQGIATSNYLFNKRFLNLTPDNPYITFTLDNGLPVMSNMQPGILKPGIPYAGQTIANYFKAFEVMAFRSSPEIVPGTWAKDIEVLKSSRFIAREALYTIPGRGVPDNEPGVYTVALIGRSATGAPAAEKAKFMIVKHTR